MNIFYPVFKFSILFVALFTVFSCSDDDTVEEPIEEEQVVDGGYVGIWNSSTSTGASFNVGISSVLQESNGNYAGPFYITTAFKAAYGTTSDGTISFRVEGDSIFDFFYNDIIPGCEGSFIGEGVVMSEDDFLITFTGNDCDGMHNGTISLKKPQ